MPSVLGILLLLYKVVFKLVSNENEHKIVEKVIDIKFAEWIGDEKMKQYIRPVTLFSNKMDQYLNQEVKVEKPDSRDLAADYFNS